jgi:hypothetical protein
MPPSAMTYAEPDKGSMRSMRVFFQVDDGGHVVNRVRAFTYDEAIDQLEELYGEIPDNHQVISSSDAKDSAHIQIETP